MNAQRCIPSDCLPPFWSGGPTSKYSFGITLPAERAVVSNVLPFLRTFSAICSVACRCGEKGNSQFTFGREVHVSLKELLLVSVQTSWPVSKGENLADTQVNPRSEHTHCSPPPWRVLFLLDWCRMVFRNPSMRHHFRRISRSRRWFNFIMLFAGNRRVNGLSVK